MSHDSEIKIGILVAAAVFITCERVWHAHKRRRSQTWRVIHGVVAETAVHKGSNEIILTIRYSYSVESEPYPITAEFEKLFPFPRDEENANRWADALSEQKIPVRVDPSNSWRSLLWESDLEAIVLANSSGLT